ncbi:septum formation family protein [Acidiferrimicrobium sp. IK]|uniref:septum formation family protein n=1 Tax=Acidiferrimicrobium sp. IK TaxID=2871700 RepID=UPI0021CAE98B|nr:septum formation family protein [Acidiferrimicrobium sp. IK]MCU4186039.1 septum formation family protein [Acidiferrimicrobium sp. IK]
MRRLTLLALVATLAAGCGSSNHSVSANESVFHLKPGSCIVPPTDIKAEVADLKVVSCKTPHTQEVFALVDDNSGDNYPGAAALRTFADGSCLQRFKAYTGVDYRDSSLFYTYLLPSVRSWAAKDRTIVCIITTTGQPLTASVKASHT